MDEIQPSAEFIHNQPCALVHIHTHIHVIYHCVYSTCMDIHCFELYMSMHLDLSDMHVIHIHMLFIQTWLYVIYPVHRTSHVWRLTVVIPLIIQIHGQILWPTHLSCRLGLLNDFLEKYFLIVHCFICSLSLRTVSLSFSVFFL